MKRMITVGRRADLEYARQGPAISDHFRKALKAQDPALEFFWAPDHYWVLYRVIRRGICPLEDVLVKQATFSGPQGQYRPLGEWVIDWLKRHDKTRGGGVDPDYADRHYLWQLFRDNQDADKQWDVKTEQLSYEYAREMEKYVFNDRRSQSYVLPSSVLSGKGKSRSSLSGIRK